MFSLWFVWREIPFAFGYGHGVVPWFGSTEFGWAGMEGRKAFYDEKMDGKRYETAGKR
jgi:hypothetical protein